MNGVNGGPGRRRVDEPLLPLKHLLTSAQVAELLGVSTRTLDHFAYMRTGPRFYKVGKVRRYHPDEVAHWLTTRCGE